MEKDAAVVQKKIQSEVDQFKALQKGNFCQKYRIKKKCRSIEIKRNKLHENACDLFLISNQI